MLKPGSLSRREFLKLGGVGMASLIMAPYEGFRDLIPDQQGRVIYGHTSVYDRPSLLGNLVKQYWVDAVIPITEVTIGDGEPHYNRIWYRIGEEGFTHSGGIQPVRTILNEPIADIPEGGQLAEVTVPYTDARWEPDQRKNVAYRFYYETTYWVVGLTYGIDNNPWYRILDDKWELVFYVPARHLRLIPPDELSTLSPDVPPDKKRIEVRTADQSVIAFEDNRPVFAARAATGAQFSNGRFYTPAGRHSTFHKRPSRHMAAGNLAYNGYDLPGVPWVCYFTERGEAFHGTYWHNDYGRPRSHGCINLTPQAAKWIYRWSLPVVPVNEQLAYEKYGTRVDVI
jgi:hypothetical protein